MYWGIHDRHRFTMLNYYGQTKANKIFYQREVVLSAKAELEARFCLYEEARDGTADSFESLLTPKEKTLFRRRKKLQWTSGQRQRVAVAISSSMGMDEVVPTFSYWRRLRRHHNHKPAKVQLPCAGAGGAPGENTNKRIRLFHPDSDHYAALEISGDATPDQIRTGYVTYTTPSLRWYMHIKSPAWSSTTGFPFHHSRTV